MTQKEKSMSVQDLTKYNSFTMPDFAGDPQRASMLAEPEDETGQVKFTGSKKTFPHQFDIFLWLTPSQDASHLKGNYKLHFPDEPEQPNTFTGELLGRFSSEDPEIVRLNPTGDLFARQVWSLSIKDV